MLLKLVLYALKTTLNQVFRPYCSLFLVKYCSLSPYFYYMIVYSEYASGKYLVDDKYSTEYNKSENTYTINQAMSKIA